MTFSLTQQNISPVAGMYAYMPNKPQLHNAVFYSATATDTIAPSAFVIINSASTNAQTPSVAVATATDIPFGMVVYDIRIPNYKVGDKLALAQSGDIVYMVAGGAISAGSKLQFDPATLKVDDTTTTGNSFIGIAVTPATADGDLIQVELNFNLGVAS